MRSDTKATTPPAKLLATMTTPAIIKYTWEICRIAASRFVWAPGVGGNVPSSFDVLMAFMICSEKKKHKGMQAPSTAAKAKEAPNNNMSHDEANLYNEASFGSSGSSSSVTWVSPPSSV
eukprot:CAMPEP_0115381630 /NCGR_PEP_ID=MMETSP0271-20121206/5673_1 /TAXON_ID=71861 /ORGANISM="Scrippsiella trochoidea, Strain CCMP3099" /LENGTH=118 /DNA_ID=CAMNT_0002804923 /DNA_START=102 /DNA_END=458 /DNA_ORIENTATION=-